jgi:hypothetical protein
MQISGTTVSPSAGPTDRNTTDSDRKAASKAAADVSAQPKAQQDKVTISDAARNAQLQDQKNAQAPATTSKAAAGQTAAGQKATADKNVNQDDTSTTETKGFVYGALGLERPEQEAANVPPDGYTAGRWLAAALTVGALVSILV